MTLNLITLSRYVSLTRFRLFKPNKVTDDIPLSIHPIIMFTLGGRNNFMAEKGLPAPKATSTGTTIVGCLFKDGIVLGADTRATEGPIVADKNCEKVFDPSLILFCV